MKDSDFPGRSALYLFQSFNALSYSIVLGSPIVLFTTWLGGGSEAVGMVTAIMPFLTIMQIPSTKYIPKWGYRRVMLAGWTARTMMLLGIVFLPFFREIWSSTLLIGTLVFCLFSWSFLRGMTNASWLPWIRALVPEERRGRYFAGEQRYIQLMTLIILIFSGVILGREPNAWRFSLLFLISFATGITSLRFLSRIPSPPVPKEEHIKDSLLKTILEVLRHKNYRQFLYFALIWTVANAGFDAFSVLFLKREAGLTERAILWLGAVGSVGMISVLFFAGGFSDKWGSRPVMKICLGGTVVCQLVWVFLAQGYFPISPPVMIPLYLVFGCVRATIWIANWRLTLISVPRSASMVALALYSTSSGILAGATPLAWGFVLDRIPVNFLSPFGYYFLFAALLNLLAFLILMRVQEDNAKHTLNVALALFQQPMRSILQMIGYSPKSEETAGNNGSYPERALDAADTRAEKSDNCSGRS